MSLAQVIQYFLLIAIGLLLVVLPQINITGYVQSTIIGKFMVFAYACLVLIGIFMVMSIVSKAKAVQITKLDIILLLLFGYITINRYAIQPEYSFSIRYMELLGLGVLYIILRNLSYKNYVWLLLAIIISGSIQAIYGNLQLLGYYPSNHSGFKLTGSFFNPGPYAGFLASVWPVALGMYLFKEKLIEQVQTQIDSSSKLVNTILRYVLEYIPLLGVISIVLVVPATHSRGAWLAVLISSILLLEFRYCFIKKIVEKLTQTKKIVLIIFTLSVFFTGLFGIYHFKKGSADGRLFIWKVTTEIIKDYPVTGVGFDRFKAHYMNYQADYFAKHGETAEALVADNTYYAFNEWLQFATENGLIGVLLLIGIIYMLLKTKVADKNKSFFLITKVTFLAIGSFALVSYPMQILPIKVILVLLLAVLGSLDRKKRYALNFENSSKYALWTFKIAVFAFGAVGLYKGAIYTQTLDNNFKQWQIASTTYQYGDYQNSTEEYSKVYPIFSKDGDFLMNYGKALAMANQNRKAAQILEEAKRYLNTTIIETALGDANKNLKNYDKAEKAYKHAANMIPVRFYPLYLQAKLYADAGEKEKAIAIAQSILEKDIKVPSTAIREIKEEMETIIKKYK